METKKDNQTKKSKTNKSIIEKIISSKTFILIILFVILMLIIQPYKFRQDLDGIDDTLFQKIEKTDSLYFVNIKKDISSQLDAFETLTQQDKVNLQKSLNSKIEKRNEIFLGEIEKENNRLMRNVVIINLIGRYTIILGCIIAFILVSRAFGSKSKGDIFE